MEELVSVVVPVYNTERYLERCLNSIRNQTYKNIEIVLVDDGSSDTSGIICDDYAANNSNVYVIHQDNAGANSARENGTEHARGDYIVFVDSDDYVEETFIENFVENIGECDICTSACNWVPIDGKTFKEKDNFDQGYYTSPSEREHIISHMIYNMGKPEDNYRGILTYMVCKMYKKDLALSVFESIDNQLQFCEDAQFVFSYMLRCKSICITDSGLYNYCHRDDSVTHKKMDHFLDSLERLYNSLSDIFSGNPLEPELMIQLESYIKFRLNLAPHYMKFKYNTGRLTYEFPFWGQFTGKRVILYGAGKVGMDYYKEIIKKNEFSIVAWVDKNHRNIRFPSVPPIRGIDTIVNVEYDVIIIASGSKLHEAIENDLISMGVSKEDIFWMPPKTITYYD